MKTKLFNNAKWLLAVALAVISSQLWATDTYTKVTSLAGVTTGDYVIIGCKTSSSFGLLTYGTLNSNRIPYTQSYTSYANLPATITDPAGASVWTLTVSTSNNITYVTLYNATNSKYIASNANPHDGKYKYDGSSGLSFTIEYESGSYGTFRMYSGTYYLGVNSSANYWRGYASGTLTATNGLTLYKKGSSKTDRTLTLSYSSTSLQVCGGNSSNPTKGGNSTEPGTETWSSSNTSVATVSNTGVVTPVGAGSATITWSVAATTNYNAGSTTASFTVSAAAARTVTWHVEGNSSTTSVTPGSQATPPTPDPTPSCGGTFVGWVATGDAVIDETPADEDTSGPTTTIYTSSNKPTITCDGNVDFYAVFKKPMDD